MGRPVAFRAAAILGYPREVQPRFRMKRPKVISGLSSNLPPHVRRLMLKRGGTSPAPRAAHTPWAEQGMSPLGAKIPLDPGGEELGSTTH